MKKWNGIWRTVALAAAIWGATGTACAEEAPPPATPPPALIPRTYWDLKDHYWGLSFPSDTLSNAVCFVYEVRPADTALPVAAVRDRAIAVMQERLAHCALAAWSRYIEILPDGDSRIAVLRFRCHPRDRRAVPEYIHALLSAPGVLSFRAVAPQSDAWARDLFAASAPPAGCGTASLPHGDYWAILPGPAPRPLAPDLSACAAPPGCSPCLQRIWPIRSSTLYRPWLLLDDAPALVLSRPAAVRPPDPAAGRPSLEIDLAPGDASALDALARGLAPSDRLAAVLDGNVCAVWPARGGMDGPTLAVPFDEHAFEGYGEKDNTPVDFYLDLAAILRSGPLPCVLDLVDVSSRPLVPAASP